MEKRVPEKTFKVEVDFVTEEFVEWINDVAEENGMDRDHFIRYILRQWLRDNDQNKSLFVDAKVYRLITAKALEKETTISNIIEHLLATEAQTIH